MTVDSEHGWALYRLVKGERWFAHKHVTPTAIRIDDSASFRDGKGQVHRWVLLRVEPEAKAYSIVIVDDAPQGLALGSPVSFMRALHRCGSFPTDQGGMLEYSGPSGNTDLRQFQPLEEGHSSNSLYASETRAGPCVAKFYRKMDGSGMREQRTLAKMEGAGFTPCLIGSIVYRPPVARSKAGPAMVCLFLERIEGTPAYQPFQSIARSALQQLERDATARLQQDHSHQSLPDLCAMLGRGIAGFHAAAHDCLPTHGTRPTLELASFADNVVRRWEHVAGLIRRSDADTHIDGRHLNSVTAALVTLASDARDNPHDIPSGFSHGDLHLSHVIFEPHSHHGRIIDPSHAIGMPGPDDHSARDLLQIRRSLECFILDETASALSVSDGCTREQAAIRLAGPANARDALYMAFAADWAAEVYRIILSAYIRHVPAKLRTPFADPRWAQVLYLDRLLHELEYDITYGRAFFFHANFAFLLRFVAPAEPGLSGKLPA